jgi:hypothetical protein
VGSTTPDSRLRDVRLRMNVLGSLPEVRRSWTRVSNSTGRPTGRGVPGHLLDLYLLVEPGEHQRHDHGRLPSRRSVRRLGVSRLHLARVIEIRAAEEIGGCRPEITRSG